MSGAATGTGTNAGGPPGQAGTMPPRDVPYCRKRARRQVLMNRYMMRIIRYAASMLSEVNATV